MRHVPAAIAVLLLCLPARAQEQPAAPDTPEQAAEKVLVAIEAGDASALGALAGRDRPDPWLVADELCFRGAHDAAEAFAGASKGRATARLKDYVTLQGRRPPDEESRRRISTLNEARRAREYERALDAAGPEGPLDSVVRIRIARARGMALVHLGRHSQGFAALRKAAEAALAMGWMTRASALHNSIAQASWERADWPTVLKALGVRLEIEETLGNRLMVAMTIGNIGLAHHNNGNLAEALSYTERALAMREALGDRGGVGRLLTTLGRIHVSHGEFRKAIPLFERSLRLREAAGDREGVAIALENLSRAHWDLYEFAEALPHTEHALGIWEEIGSRARMARTLNSLGMIRHRLCEFRRSLSLHERALELAEELGDWKAAATALSCIGIDLLELGDLRKGLAFHGRALALREAKGDRLGAATSLRYVGLAHRRLGDYAAAFSTLERALEIARKLGSRQTTASVLQGLGILHKELGDYRAAVSCYERSLEIGEQLDDRFVVAAALGNLGVLHRRLGDYEKALTFQELSLRMHEATGDRNGVATTLTNIANLHSHRGDFRKALALQERALEINRDLGDQAGEWVVLGNIGWLHFDLGDYPKASECMQRALEISTEIGSVEGVLGGHEGLAATHLATGHFAEAIAASRSAVEMLGLLAGGLAEEQGARTRERFRDVFATGFAASVEVGDVGEACYFLESGRAGSLLEFLGGRDSLQSFLVTEDLRETLDRAREAESVAAHRLSRALQGGKRKETRECRAELAAARDDVLHVIQRVQREAKAAANVLYPRAASLDRIVTLTGAGEALVLFSLNDLGAHALVVSGGKGRIVSLGDTAKLREALGALALTDPARASSAEIDAIRDLVLAPLRLPEGTTRLLISPHGELSLFPFSLVFPGEVVYAPSGTTYGVLLDELTKEGEGVLALGDPDYRSEVEAEGVAALHRGGNLTPLPATREEVKSVGDVLLLGKDATEAGLVEAIGKRDRWRAVHLACHGLIDAERPTFSSLAITPDSGSDGFLTCLEVFRMRIPADLVVLSACETAKGKVYQAEGIVGLTRAFMMAGAPRVICSLWKVDDEATRALMVKFYELWNPKEGEGLPAATALRQAQEFVKSHEKWEHPYYWAAWVLWGLPD